MIYLGMIAGNTPFYTVDTIVKYKCVFCIFFLTENDIYEKLFINSTKTYNKEIRPTHYASSIRRPSSVIFDLIIRNIGTLVNI